MFLLIVSILTGGYFYSTGFYEWFLFCFISVIILTLAVLILTSKYYNVNILPIRSHNLIDEHEKYNARFLSTNADIGPAKNLAAELFKRSNEYIYIYTGEYNEMFYSDLKPILEEKKKKQINVAIIAENAIQNKAVIPEGIIPKEHFKINGMKHFIVADYGFRLEISDIYDKKVEAIFALNLSKAKNVEDEVTNLHKKLKLRFQEAWG